MRQWESEITEGIRDLTFFLLKSQIIRDSSSCCCCTLSLIIFLFASSRALFFSYNSFAYTLCALPFLQGLYALSQSCPLRVQLNDFMSLMKKLKFSQGSSSFVHEHKNIRHRWAFGVERERERQATKTTTLAEWKWKLFFWLCIALSSRAFNIPPAHLFVGSVVVGDCYQQQQQQQQKSKIQMKMNERKGNEKREFSWNLKRK